MEERFPGYRNSPWRKSSLRDTLCVSKSCPPKSHHQPLESPGRSAEPNQAAKVVTKTRLLFDHILDPSLTKWGKMQHKRMWPVNLQPSLSEGNNDNTIKWQPHAKYTEMKTGCYSLIPVTFSSSGFITPQYCLAEPLFFACFLINFTVNLSFSDQSDL